MKSLAGLLLILGAGGVYGTLCAIVSFGTKALLHDERFIPSLGKRGVIVRFPK